MGRIVERLRQQGNLPYLITDPQTLRGVHLEALFGLNWRNMHSAIGTTSGYLDLYQTHIKSYEYQWKQCPFAMIWMKPAWPMTTKHSPTNNLYFQSSKIWILESLLSEILDVCCQTIGDSFEIENNNRGT